ncbi:MAG: hypothetical protein Q4B32_00820 [Clostridia bacterium]|nr:hypothetical protein [Clostridia bacterium]
MKKQGQTSDGMVFLPRRIGRFALGEGEGFVPCKVQKSQQEIIGGTDLFLREKLLRRKLQEEADSPEVLAWRRLMSLLLLWDGWATTDTLRFHDFDGESPLVSAILSTADETRREEGLRVLCLHHGEQVVPIGLGSKAVTAVPIPLTMQEEWPDSMRRIMGQENPCLQMHDKERILAEKRLKLVIESLQEEEQAKPFKAFLCALQETDGATREEVSDGHEETQAALLVRVKSVCGLYGEKHFQDLTLQEEGLHLGEDDVFFHCFDMHDEDTDETVQVCRTYAWQGKPFAREDGQQGLSPVHAPGEEETLAILAREIQFLEQHASQWREKLGERMQTWAKEHACLPAVFNLLQSAGEEAIAASKTRQTEILLRDEEKQTAPCGFLWLMEQALGEKLACAGDVFTQGLTLLPNDAPADVSFGEQAAVKNALIPMTADFAAAVAGEDSIVVWKESQPCVSFDGEGYTAAITLAGQQTVTLTKTYAAEDVLSMRWEEIPTIGVWPGIALPKDRWQCYTTFVHLPTGTEELNLSVKMLFDGAWQEGRHHTAEDGGLWWLLQTKAYPRAFCVQVNGHDMGILPVARQESPIPAGEAVTAAVDMGISGTSMLLKQGDSFLDTGKTPGMRWILAGTGKDLAAAVLPSTPLLSAMPSAEEISGDGNTIFEDGRMFRQGEPASNVTYGLKYGTTGTAMGRPREMYLRQLMTEGSLTAVLHGANSIRWRFAVPTGMAADGRKTWQADMKRLAEQVAAQTGLPAAAVAFAEEHQAEQTYFREIEGIRGGMMVLDVGGSSAEMTLWLHGISQPVTSCSLPLGVQMMLLESLTRRASLLREPLPEGQEPLQQAMQRLAERLEGGMTSLKAMQQGQMELDAFLGTFGRAVMGTPGEMANGCMLIRSELLIHEAFLLTLAGLMLEGAFQDATLNDRLPPYMELCFAGRGAAGIRDTDEVTRQKLKQFIRLGMSRNHPTRDHPLVFSKNPKQEITLGLMRMKQMQEEIPDAPRVRKGQEAIILPVPVVLERFLLQLAVLFPQESALVFPESVENGQLTEMMRRRVIRAVNTGGKVDADLLMQCAAAFIALKQHEETA